VLITGRPGLLACGLMYRRIMHKNKAPIYAPVWEQHDLTVPGGEVGKRGQLRRLTLKHDS